MDSNSALCYRNEFSNESFIQSRADIRYCLTQVSCFPDLFLFVWKIALSMKNSVHKGVSSALICSLCLWRHLQEREIQFIIVTATQSDKDYFAIKMLHLLFWFTFASPKSLSWPCREARCHLGEGKWGHEVPSSVLFIWEVKILIFRNKWHWGKYKEP